MTLEDFTSAAAMLQLQLQDEVLMSKYREQFCTKIPQLEDEDNEKGKILQRMKPLCSHFVFFVQHIAAKKDKN